MSDSWPWDQPANCGVITERSIIENGAPILHVSHDADDHGWQFLGGGKPKVENARIVCLSCIPDLDPTVLELTDLPPGWIAWRNSASEPWKREPHDDVDGDEI